ncbi:general secretion pathway protein GspE [Geothermobacter hydrogeniphilus]|uniref:General secretion pathway protein GspE n=1 Tax=Geothermobacter hydrogeniphilus TaxID=1969733 RepID=A0A2K2H843_9BACT|nr:general secretion pathway protein GspE [Geothermobacter hydrogeniphilus]PNU19400.1 general secretion pathway protein GspE [Geothermobacter hydrogeniphilus]
MAVTLLEMLREADLITREQFDEALLNRVVYGGKIGTSLIELGLIEEETLARFLSRKLAVPYVHPDQLQNVPADVIQKVPRGLALKYKVVPIKFEKKRLSLAMADPADLRAIDEIAFITDFIIKPLIAPEVRLLQALGRYYDYEIEERFQNIIARIGEWKGTAAEAEAVQQAHEETDEEKLEEAVVIEEEPPAVAVPETMESVAEGLASATSREEIGEVMIRYLGQEFSHAALFVLREDKADGWKAVAGQKNLDDFPQFSIDLTKASVVRTVIEEGSPYLGGLPNRGQNGRLIKALGGEKPTSVLLLPVKLARRTVNVLYIAGGEGSLGERMADLNRLVRKMSLAFEILIRREKILMT